MFINILRFMALASLGIMAYLHWPQILSAKTSLSETVSQNAPYAAPSRTGVSTAKIRPAPVASAAPVGAEASSKLLTQSSWISDTAGVGACATQSDSHWQFNARQRSPGHICRASGKSDGKRVYICEKPGTIRKWEYVALNGSAYLGKADLDRPYITLERVNRPSQKIGLKMCLPGDRVSSVSENAAPKRPTSG